VAIDRKDPNIAEGILGRLCRDLNARRYWAQYALQSIDIARSISPDSWEITLFPERARLNVGQVAVLELWQDTAAFYCCAPVLVNPSEEFRKEKGFGYRAVKVKTDRWFIDVNALTRVPPPLIEKHLELVRLAADAKKISPFRAAHSPGLFAYLEELAGRAPKGEDRLFADEVAYGRYSEGAVRSVTVNAYERDKEARRCCIQHYGPKCVVCGMDFGTVYGAADGFIHVHHLKALSEIGAEYRVNPVADLRPVCPNCHAVIHLGGQTRSIEDVRKLLESTGRANRVAGGL
jgi:hypothetical protein